MARPFLASQIVNQRMAIALTSHEGGVRELTPQTQVQNKIAVTTTGTTWGKKTVKRDATDDSLVQGLGRQGGQASKLWEWPGVLVTTVATCESSHLTEKWRNHQTIAITHTTEVVERNRGQRMEGEIPPVEEVVHGQDILARKWAQRLRW